MTGLEGLDAYRMEWTRLTAAGSAAAAAATD